MRAGERLPNVLGAGATELLRAGAVDSKPVDGGNLFLRREKSRIGRISRDYEYGPDPHDDGNQNLPELIRTSRFEIFSDGHLVQKDIPPRLEQSGLWNLAEADGKLTPKSPTGRGSRDIDGCTETKFFSAITFRLV